MTGSLNKFGLSGNALKLIALVAMTIDHIGVSIFPDIPIFRIIGRLAFPIFAYMIAEGCTYTRSKIRYLASIGTVALLCQTVYFWFCGSLYQCIFVTFFLSVVMVYATDNLINKKDGFSAIIAIITLALILIVTNVLPNLLSNTDFAVDYGIFGVMVPVLVYVAPGKIPKLFALIVGLVFLSYASGYIQWYSLLSVVPLLFYNGQRGMMNTKWLFYVYYPVHLVLIWCISMSI